MILLVLLAIYIYIGLSQLYDEHEVIQKKVISLHYFNNITMDFCNFYNFYL